VTVSLAFNGAFFAWPYQAGVAAYAQERGLLDDTSRVYGTSSGAVVAVMLATGVDIARVGLSAGLEANARAQGERRLPFFAPSGVIPTYFEVFGRALPADAHQRASGRLFIATTQVPRFKRILISDYPTREALLDALAATIAIPGVTVGFARRTQAHGWCLDGGPEVPDDDRAGVQTIRIGVGPRMPMLKADHITPSRTIGVAPRILIQPEPERRALFTLGYGDGARYWRDAAQAADLPGRAATRTRSAVP
jgi:hypothetical protein